MNIIFVCAGNTCRSCMAEAIFNKLNTIHNITCSSAGVFVINNSVISHNAYVTIKNNLKVDLNSRRAVLLEDEMIKNSHIILTMTHELRDLLRDRFSLEKNKIFALSEYVGKGHDILDPFGRDESVYQKTFDELYEKILLLIDKLKEDKSIIN